VVESVLHKTVATVVLDDLYCISKSVMPEVVLVVLHFFSESFSNGVIVKSEWIILLSPNFFCLFRELTAQAFLFRVR
jgi:hypothetical protein